MIAESLNSRSVTALKYYAASLFGQIGRGTLPTDGRSLRFPQEPWELVGVPSIDEVWREGAIFLIKPICIPFEDPGVSFSLEFIVPHNIATKP